MTQEIQHSIPFFRALRLICAAVLVLCAGTFSTAPAAAMDGALMTGKTLSLLCSSAKADDQFACQTYIAGVIDYHRLLKSLGTAPSVDFCLPSDLKMEQIKAMVTQYVLAHSEHQDFIAAPAVAMSLFNAYPCKAARRRK